jgi:amidase
MNVSDYAGCDAVELVSLIRRGEVTTVDVTEAAINAIEVLNPKLNAVVLRNFDNARQFAAAPQCSSPIAGAPFLLKDVNVFSADMPTTFSCRFFADAAPKADSEIVTRWRNSGLNILGKSNTPEFAEDFVCEPTFRGATLNPWNPLLTTGGSSGGAGAAVASGMVPIAHATDLGGSIRIPAACCGVFGLKPTSGLNPQGHYYLELANGLNADHVLTRSVRDSAAALDATAGPLAGTRYQVERGVKSYLAALDLPVPKLRIGLCLETPAGELPGERQVRATEIVADTLQHLGHTIVEYSYPPEATGIGAWAESLWMIDVVHELDKRIEALGREPDDSELEALTRYARSHVATLSAMDLYTSRQRAHEIGMKLMASMGHLDLLLTPALGSDPIPLGSLDSRTDAFNFQAWAEQGHRFAPFAYICNLAGQPAASLPVQLVAGEHPLAVQLAGHHRQDHLILQVAAQLESHFEWRRYIPPIWAGDCPWG